MCIGGIGTVLAQHYTKIFMPIFCAKIFQYSDYTFCIQKESTHFGLRVSIIFSLKVSAYFGLKNHARKINNIHLDF